MCDRPYVRSGQHVDLFPVLKYNISTPIVKKRGPEPFPSSATIGEVKYNNIQYRERLAREVIFFSFSLSQSIDVEDIIIRSASLGYCICLRTVYISLLPPLAACGNCGGFRFPSPSGRLIARSAVQVCVSLSVRKLSIRPLLLMPK